MSEVIFEAGDVVTCAFFGDKEFVLESNDSDIYPVCIFFTDEGGGSSVTYFTKGGLLARWHKVPVLKLVRKKIKKRVVIELFKVNSENESFFLNNNEFGSYDDALDWIKSNGLNGWTYFIDKLYKIKDL